MQARSVATPSMPWLAARWLRPLNDAAAVDDLLGLVNPMWSLREIRARVLAIEDESADTRSYWLAPNRHWPGFAAGQYVPVFFELDGRRLQRCYSLSSSPRDARLRITVRRQAGGRFSHALHQQLRVGDVLTLGAPAGDFTLPQAPRHLLLVGAGSGMTPLMAQLHALRDAGHAGRVRCIQICRTPSDAIFAAERAALTADWPALEWIVHDTAARGRPDPQALLGALDVPSDWQLMLCGPGAFMTAMRAAWAARGLADRVRSEAFSLAPLPPAAVQATAVDVRCERTQRVFTARTQQPLLSEAEAGGLSPRHGCRMGICHACKCMKKSGRVRNLLTGEISDAPDTPIQLCISAAQSDLILDL